VLTCPYPIPQSQTTPFNPGEFLAFESPFLDLSGPFAAYNVPTLGEIAPLVPFASPLVSISEPVMNAVTPNMAQAIYDFVALEHQAGLDNPSFDKYVAQFEPYWLQLVGQLTPYEQALASSTAGQCTVLFENELATVAAEHNIPIPQPPLVVPDTTGGSKAASDAGAVAAAVQSSSARPPAVQLSLPWSGGMPAGLPGVVKQLAADKVPVEVDLVDTPPVGRAIGNGGFADFVASAVHGLPAASIFEVDVPTTTPAGAAAVADLVHGLAAADFTRQPGQLIGMGVAPAATGDGAPAFWSAFAAAAQGYQASLVDFVAADLTTGATGSLSAVAAQAAATARALEHEWSTVGGVPPDVPLFATVDLVGSGLSASAARQELAAFHGALAGLHVGMLGLGMGADESR
jgi:hypothetical protein